MATRIDKRPTRRVVVGELKNKPHEFVVELDKYVLKLKPLHKKKGQVTIPYSTLYEYAMYKEAMAAVKPVKRKVSRGRI